VGLDDTVDSDVDQATGKSHVFFLEGNTTITNVDVGTIGGAAVVGRHIFYNQSRYDGLGQGANPLDDGAIAPDKAALLPGQTATFANYTSYTRGINGVMIDVMNLPSAGQIGSLTAGDFVFKVGNSNTPSAWAPAPNPGAISVRPGAGIGGSDRITILWQNNAIMKQWLQITVNATAATGLTSPDIFYFGNAIAESGNNQFDARVTVSDEVAARNNPYSAAAQGSPVLLNNRWDYNRDGNVSAQDQISARNNQTTVVAALRLITAPALLQPEALTAQPLVLAVEGAAPLESVSVTSASAQSLVADGGRIGRLFKSPQAAAGPHFALAEQREGLPERTERVAADVDETLIELLATDCRARGR
jgi:hypothetical protein